MTPGPGNYNVSQRPASPKHSFSRSKKYKNCRQTTPGPGDYKIDSLIGNISSYVLRWFIFMSICHHDIILRSHLAISSTVSEFSSSSSIFALPCWSVFLSFFYHFYPKMENHYLFLFYSPPTRETLKVFPPLHWFWWKLSSNFLLGFFLPHI